ncbi:MAG: BspA family leucine-rich repeat surface protein [Ruminococcus sp.]|nr:BspA family leucine-rich repeat surface protein [Ruminococcus sp.]
MEKNLMKKTAAAIMAVALTGSGMYAPVVNKAISGSSLTAYAEEAASTASFDEETGILTLSGNVLSNDVKKWKGNDNVKKVVCAEGTKLPADSSSLFSNFRAEEIDLSNADTSEVTTMADMFYRCVNLRSLDLSSFNTSSVVNMGYMFTGCSSLVSLDLSSFDTSKVKKMTDMFHTCSSLEYVDFSGFDTSSVTDMKYIFYGCDALKPNMIFLKGQSVTLDSYLGANIYIEPCANLAKVVLSGPNGDITYSGSQFDGLTQDDGRYKFTYLVNATQANENITVKAYDKDGRQLIVCKSANLLSSRSQVEYSVSKYISDVKNTGSIMSVQKIADLVNGLDNYCKAAENYFNKTDNVIEGIDNIDMNDVNKYAPGFGTDISLSLVLNSMVAVRLYTDSSDVEINSDKATAKTKNGLQYYELSDIPAHSLCNMYTASINGTKYDFGPMSYVYRVLNNNDASPALTSMAKATYVYANAAKAYKN